jgi:hypothetical protein
MTDNYTFLPQKLAQFVNFLAISAFLVHVFVPNAVFAAIPEEEATIDLGSIPTTIENTPEGRLFHPNITLQTPDKRVHATITAYTSTPEQTDGSPFIAASGKRVHDGMIAANWLPFGTIVKIPSLFGEKEFIVEDRMNSRYGYGVLDIWFDSTTSEARKFGIRHRDVEIYYPETAVHLAHK